MEASNTRGYVDIGFLHSCNNNVVLYGKKPGNIGGTASHIKIHPLMVMLTSLITRFKGRTDHNSKASQAGGVSAEYEKGAENRPHSGAGWSIAKVLLIINFN